MSKLTNNQERFVQELIKGKSQREAYRIAYPRSVNWKDSAVDVNASKLFNNTKVVLRYNEINNRLVKEAEDECIVTAKEILRELKKVAFADGSDFAQVVTRTVIDRDTGEESTYKTVDLIDTHKLPANKRAAISSIKETKFGVAVESYDKVKALELLGKTLGMFKDKVEHTGAVPVFIKDDMSDE